MMLWRTLYFALQLKQSRGYRPCWKWCRCLAAVCATPVVVLLLLAAATVVVAALLVTASGAAAAAAAVGCGENAAAVAASAIGASDWRSVGGGGGVGFRGRRRRWRRDLDPLQLSEVTVCEDCGEGGRGRHSHIGEVPLSWPRTWNEIGLTSSWMILKNLARMDNRAVSIPQN